MASKLKIYACSGVDAINESAFDYWLDNNANILRNTQAVNTLFALIDGLYANLRYGSYTPAEQVRILNSIDLYSVALFYAQNMQNSMDDLKTVGRVLGSLLQEGVFEYESLDNEERDKHLDDLYEIVEEALKRGDEYKGDPNFSAWWQQNVIARNKVGMTNAEITRFEECIANAFAGLKQIGVIDESYKEQEWAKYIDHAGDYFLYIFFTQKQLAKLPKRFTDKALKQKEIYNYCKSFFVNVYGSEAEMLNRIRTNIIKDLKATPEQICAEIASGKREEPKGVGEIIALLTAITKLIATIAPIIIALIYGIVDYCKTANANKYKAIDEQTVKQNILDEDDFNGLEFSDWKKYIPYVAAGAGVLLFLLNRRN